MAETNDRDTFNYQLLSRLQQDCEYYLGCGARNKKHLWALDETEQIQKMKELYAALPEKPEWITLADIEKYEATMLGTVEGTLATSDLTTPAVCVDAPAVQDGEPASRNGTVMKWVVADAGQDRKRVIEDDGTESGRLVADNLAPDDAQAMVTSHNILERLVQTLNFIVEYSGEELIRTVAQEALDPTASFSGLAATRICP